MNQTSTDLLTGTILHLQRLSTEDGPGIRTTVFYKGCPLNCTWCHNPESVSIQPQVQWVGVHCIGCHTCIDVCPQHGLSATARRVFIAIGKLCTACGTCVDACPSNAMEMLGKQVTPAELVDELLKDRAYFEKSGGGVTLSGGEPTLQPAFTLELLMQLKLQGIQTALDTCGLCSQDTLADLLPWVDVLLFDLKLADSTQHKAWTGRRQRTHSGQPEMGLRSGRRGFPFPSVMGQNTIDPGGNLYAREYRGNWKFALAICGECTRALGIVRF